jgi:hypothetical protein
MHAIQNFVASCLAAFSVLELTAQDQYRVFAPTKDVAMLVDVSVSVKKDTEGHEEALGIIQAIVSGEGIGASKFKSNWSIDANPEMAGLFGAYLGQVTDGDSAELRPLMDIQNSFLSMHIGTVETVLTQGRNPIRLKKTDEIKELIKTGYPSIRDMNDKSTCFWLAMARAAATLSQSSKLGYYLFVVSDEEDDPDYRKEGPSGHTYSDYINYRDNLSKTYPETAIRGEISRYFDYKGTNSRDVDMYQPRGDFKQVPIAKFTHTAYREKKARVKIAWYAMGVVPQRVHVPRVIQPVQAEPLVIAPEVYQPPKLEPTLKWLGGLSEVPRKLFNYKAPLLVWQVTNAEVASYSASGKPSLLIEGRSHQVKKLTSSRHDLQTAILTDKLADGSMAASLRTDGLESEEVKFEVQRPTLGWLYLLAGASAIIAVAVFAISWRSLRQTGAKKPRTA